MLAEACNPQPECFEPTPEPVHAKQITLPSPYVGLALGLLRETAPEPNKHACLPA